MKVKRKIIDNLEVIRKISGPRIAVERRKEEVVRGLEAQSGKNSPFFVFLEILKTLFSFGSLFLVVSSYGKYELYVGREVFFLSLMFLVFAFIISVILSRVGRLVETSYKILIIPYLTGMGMFTASPWREMVRVKSFLMKKNFTPEELQWAIHCRFNDGTPIYADFAVHYKWGKAIEVTNSSLECLEAKVYKDLQLYWMMEAHPVDLWWSGAGKFIYPTLSSTWWLMGIGGLVQIAGFLYMAYYFKEAGRLNFAVDGKVDELASGARRAFYNSMDQYELGFSNWSARALWSTMSMSILYGEMLGDYEAFQSLKEERFYTSSDKSEYQYTEELAPFIERDKKGYIAGDKTVSIRLRQLPGWPTQVPGKWVDPIKGKPFRTLVLGAYFPKESEWKGPWE